MTLMSSAKKNYRFLNKWFLSFWVGMPVDPVRPFYLWIRPFIFICPIFFFSNALAIGRGNFEPQNVFSFLQGHKNRSTISTESSLRSGSKIAKPFFSFSVWLSGYSGHDLAIPSTCPAVACFICVSSRTKKLQNKTPSGDDNYLWTGTNHFRFMCFFLFL